MTNEWCIQEKFFLKEPDPLESKKFFLAARYCTSALEAF
jgi:hypothetical protein